MADRAVIQGNYADLKFIKGRKCAQIIIEIPTERAAEFIKLFGAPDPAAECPVAIARLTSTVPADEPAKPKKRWDELPPSQQAAIRCNEPEFQEFLGVPSADDAAAEIRRLCGVASRSQIIDGKPSAAYWRKIDNQFVIHKRGYEEMQH
jgi:hypothetical protein